MNHSLHPKTHPDFLSNPLFIFEPLHPKHVALDYKAVMNTAEFLQKWSASSWPAKDFRLEDNLKDLEWHFSEHQEGTAFTYTILNPHKTTCLGCIYLNPSSRINPVISKEKHILNQISAVCTYWVESTVSLALEEIIFTELRNWLSLQWQFPDLVYANNPQTPHQSQIFLSHGLQLWYSLTTNSRYQNLWKPLDKQHEL